MFQWRLDPIYGRVGGLRKASNPADLLGLGFRVQGLLSQLQLPDAATLTHLLRSRFLARIPPEEQPKQEDANICKTNPRHSSRFEDEP